MYFLFWNIFNIFVLKNFLKKEIACQLFPKRKLLFHLSNFCATKMPQKKFPKKENFIPPVKILPKKETSIPSVKNFGVQKCSLKNYQKRQLPKKEIAKKGNFDLTCQNMTK